MERPRLSELIDRQRPGFSLEQPFYRDPEIFEREMDRVFMRQWLLVDHVSRIPEAGDYLLFEIAGESIIVIRSEEGAVNAFFNVCRHRGSRICEQASGNHKRLVCNYHAWAYDLDGELVAWRHISPDLDASEFGLHRCQVRVSEGLIFVCLSDAAPDLDAAIEAMTPYLRLHGTARSKVAHVARYPTHGNWKLTLENFLECYHCTSSHPQYTSVNAYVRAEEHPDSNTARAFGGLREQWTERAEALGYITEAIRADGANGVPRFAAYRDPIREGFQTCSEDGKPVAPLMGEFTEYDGGVTSMGFGYFGFVVVPNDYATMFRFSPVSADLTEVCLTWLVHEDAEEGVDYDVDRLKWMWDLTTQQDAVIIETNSRGVASRRYQPGPYSALEGWTNDFIRWYLGQMGRVPSGPNSP